MELQTRFLAFMDCFHVLDMLTLCVAPLVLLTKNFKLGGKAPPAHGSLVREEPSQSERCAGG